VTSDGGLVLVRELDERLRMSELVDRHLSDSRRGKNIQLPLADLLRQSIYSRLAGYEDVNDAARLSQDPTFRLIGSRKIWERGAALTSRLQSFETEVLTQADNLAGLAALNRGLVARVEAIDSPRRIVPDMDSTEIPVYGEQEQSAYNGHFESICYHPLLLFNREGDCLAAKLRPGNVHSAEGWEELLLPEIERQQRLSKEVVFRADAAFAKPELYEALEERDVKYAIRLPANDNLQRNIPGSLTRPVGRPSHRPAVRFKSFLYQAASWKRLRRVVAKVEFPCGELFPRVGFIVTNSAASSRAVVRFYNKRGTAEQWIKEGKQAMKMTRLSCHRFRSNEVRLWLSLILLQPRESVAAAGAASADRRLVADQLAAAPGENRRTVDQARTLLLAATCGEPSDAPALWKHAAEDRGAAIARGIGDPQGGADFGDAGGWREGELSTESIGKTAFSGVA